jgi:iron complex transport system substrate-binding protein
MKLTMKNRRWLYIIIMGVTGMYIAIQGSINKNDSSKEQQTSAENQSAKTSQSPETIGRLSPGQIVVNGPRIVTLWPSITETVFALGLGDNIVGVTQQCEYPFGALMKPLAGDTDRPDIEAIINAEADFVIAPENKLKVYALQRLEDAGIKVLPVKLESTDEYFESVLSIGRAINITDKAQQLIENIKNELKTLTAELARADSKPQVLWIVQRDPMRAAAANTFANELVTLSGGKNIITDTQSRYPPINDKSLGEIQADIIIEQQTTERLLSAQLIRARVFYNQFEDVPAVKENRIFIAPAGLTKAPGPRLAQAVKTIAKHLHPSLFTESLQPAR